MNSIKINYDKEELEIDGEKITKPFIVKVPYVDSYQKAKVFNHKNGWKAGEKLPCISIQGGESVKENTDELIVDGKLFTGESAKRATQIVKALEGLTIREAQDLLERVNIHLLNFVVTTDR